MADHLRQRIRKAAAAALEGLPTTADRVFDSRTVNVPANRLPCLLVYTLEEEIETATMAAARRQVRTVELIVEGLAIQGANVEDTLDRIALEVEPVLGNNELGGLAKDIQLASTGVALSGDAEQPTGTIRLGFDVDYETLEDDPSSAA